MNMPRGPIRDGDGRLYPDGGNWSPVKVSDKEVEENGGWGWIDQMQNWCYQKWGNGPWMCIHIERGSHFEFRFQDPEAALLFKLTWL